jgi:hypothetical protein
MFNTNLLAQNYDDIMQPYDKDENTMMLMHFDGDFANASDSSDDGIGYGNPTFIGSELTGFGNMLWMDNDSRSDSTWLEIPHADALTLQENYTLEGWIKFISHSASRDDWNWRPLLIVKPWNYKFEVKGYGRNASPNYRTVNNDYVVVSGQDEIFNIDEWVHWTNILDSENGLYMLLVHNEAGELIDFNYIELDPNLPPPRPNTNSVRIGYILDGLGGGFIDGFIDEVRVSNVIRNVSIPAIFKPNWRKTAVVSSGQSIEVETDIIEYSGSLNAPKLFYSTGADFQSVDLSTIDSLTFTATIPGQPAGTDVKYYFEVETALGTFNTLGTGRSDSAYYGVAVRDDLTAKIEMLHLDFEEDSGAPYDSSDQQIAFTAFGNPVYSTDKSVTGSKSLYLEGDSSYVEAPQPSSYLLANDVTVDAWFNIDVFNFTESDTWYDLMGRMVEFQGDWDFNYRIWLSNSDGGPHVNGEILTTYQDKLPGHTLVELTDYILEENKWYHVILRVSDEKDLLAIELYDQDENLLTSGSKLFEGGTVNTTQGAFRIGTAYDWAARFRGYIDNVHIYNYSEVNLPPSITAIHQDKVMVKVGTDPVDISVSAKNATAVTLSYFVAGGDTTHLLMSTVDDSLYTAQIPYQENTAVEYFIVATNAGDDVARVPIGGPNYGIGFATDSDVQTLGLNFEEGSGVPQDASVYLHQLTMIGNPQFSTDAKEGTYSISLEGDSSFLQVKAPAPFLASKEISVSLWFKTNVDPARATDLFGKWPNNDDNPSSKWNFSARLWFDNGNVLKPEIKLVDENGENITNRNFALQTVGTEENYIVEKGKWYHITVDVGVDSACAVLKDESGTIVAQNGISIAGLHLNPAEGEFNFGRVSTHSAYGNRPYLNGYLDDIIIYNYAALVETAIEDEDRFALPINFELLQNYPNPFNPTTEIRFAVPKAQKINLIIYNILGQKVKTLIDDKVEAGYHNVRWNGTNNLGYKVSSGVYLYRLETEQETKVKKMVLVR